MKKRVTSFNFLTADTRRWFRYQWCIAIGWLVIAGAIGVVLRSLMLWPTESLNYAFWLHAHSHVMLLGWAFNALLTSICTAFLTINRARTYHPWWLGLQVSVLGMLVFFPIQGYALGSILFSTLHVGLSYGVGSKLWRDLRKDRTLSASLLRWGVMFLFLSTLGPYVVGILKAKGLAQTNEYTLAIYFYLQWLVCIWCTGLAATPTRRLESPVANPCRAMVADDLGN